MPTLWFFEAYTLLQKQARHNLQGQTCAKDKIINHGTEDSHHCVGKPSDFVRPRGRLSLFRYWSRLPLFSLWDVWSLSCPNSKVFREDFLLFVFATGDNTRTDLWIWCFQQTLLYWSCLCGSGLANFTLYRFLDKWTQWSKISNLASTRITNTTWILLTF